MDYSGFRGYASTGVVDFDGQFEQYLGLVEFTYNNIYHSSIEMAPFEALYGMCCHCPVGWFDTFKIKHRGMTYFVILRVVFWSFRIHFELLRVGKSVIQIIVFVP